MFALAMNISAVMHSYTIMSISNMDGQLVGKLLNVLRKEGDAFLPTVLPHVNKLVIYL